MWWEDRDEWPWTMSGGAARTVACARTRGQHGLRREWWHSSRDRCSGCGSDRKEKRSDKVRTLTHNPLYREAAPLRSAVGRAGEGVRVKVLGDAYRHERSRMLTTVTHTGHRGHDRSARHERRTFARARVSRLNAQESAVAGSH